MLYMVIADVVGLRPVHLPGLQILDGDLRSGNGRSARIGNRSSDIAIGKLALHDTPK